MEVYLSTCEEQERRLSDLTDLNSYQKYSSKEFYHVAADSAYRAWTHLVSHLLGNERPGSETVDSQFLRSEALIIYAIVHYSGADAEVSDRAEAFLECRQAPSGVWHLFDQDQEGALAATTWAVLALDRSGSLIAQAAAQRGRRWIKATIEKASQSLSDFGHAFALAALTTEHNVNLPSEQVTTISGILDNLAWSQHANGRWVRPKFYGSIDPALTAWVLSSLHRADQFVASTSPRLKEAIQSLSEDQRTDGFWSDGPSIDANVVATSTAILALLEYDSSHENLVRGISWIVETQEQNGGWQNDPKGNGRTSLEATALAMLALDKFASSPTNPDNTVSQVNIDVRSETLSSESIYDLSICETWHGLPQTRPLDHTMYQALDRYAEEKLPVPQIEDTILSGGSIEIHGVYPAHFSALTEDRGLTSISLVDFDRKPATKKFNWVRPKFFHARRDQRSILAVAVIPGRDYFFHYATIVRHYIHKLTENPSDFLSLYRYPVAERRLSSWTEFNHRFVHRGDRVILGYVEEIADLLKGANIAEQIGCDENDFYGSYRYRLFDGSTLNLLGVKFSFWGSISASLVESICHSGATEIIYLAKLGALSSPEHIYSRIFAPQSFFLVHHDTLISKIESPPNRILEWSPHISTGAHVSVPTVLEEDYKMRRTVTEFGAQSIDNEISQMAEAVAIHNSVHKTEVTFSAIHFATDYIRSESERTLTTTFDLGNDKIGSARINKRKMISRIAEGVLFPYLNS